MKLASKVLLIIGIVVLALTLFIFTLLGGFSLPYGILFIILAFTVILPFLIVHIIALSILNKESKNSLLVMGIILLFVSTVVGILFIIMSTEQNETQKVESNLNLNDYDKRYNLEKELRKLDDLRNRDLLTEDEYKNARQKTIDRFIS